MPIPLLLAIAQVVQTTDTVMGSATAKAVLSFLAERNNLTPEQIQNLEANHADNLRRLEKLRDEIGS